MKINPELFTEECSYDDLTKKEKEIISEELFNQITN